MADISKITLPSGTTYNIKDAQARSQIAALSGGDAVVFVGVSSVELTDGGTETPKVDNVDKTPSAGQLFFYETQEFIWGQDNKWHALGSLDSLGALAYKDNASGSYKPEGTVSKPTFTGSSSTVTITATDNTSGNYQPKGTVSKPNFTGSNSTFSGTFTPEGTVSVRRSRILPLSSPLRCEWFGQEIRLLPTFVGRLFRLEREELVLMKRQKSADERQECLS